LKGNSAGAVLGEVYGQRTNEWSLGSGGGLGWLQLRVLSEGLEVNIKHLNSWVIELSALTSNWKP